MECVSKISTGQNLWLVSRTDTTDYRKMKPGTYTYRCWSW